MAEEEKKVFGIDYECNNCGNKFQERYGKGSEVSTSSIRGAVGVSKTPHVKPWPDPVRCPVCNSEKIKILERKPLGL